MKSLMRLTTLRIEQLVASRIDKGFNAALDDEITSIESSFHEVDP